MTRVPIRFGSYLSLLLRLVFLSKQEHVLIWSQIIAQISVGIIAELKLRYLLEAEGRSRAH